MCMQSHNYCTSCQLLTVIIIKIMVGCRLIAKYTGKEGNTGYQSCFKHSHRIEYTITTGNKINEGIYLEWRKATTIRLKTSPANLRFTPTELRLSLVHLLSISATPSPANVRGDHSYSQQSSYALPEASYSVVSRWTHDLSWQYSITSGIENSRSGGCW